jgi:hypothetical protein
MALDWPGTQRRCGQDHSHSPGEFGASAVEPSKRGEIQALVTCAGTWVSLRSARWLIVVAIMCMEIVTGRMARAAEFMLTYQPAPADNPLKGLVPYAEPTPDRFPHSLEFSYLPLSALQTGFDEFDWQPLETLLDGIASRGNQTVFRIYLEYPGKTEGIPTFLVEGGLKVHEYLNTNTQPFPPQKVRTPDYEDPQLRRALRSFIKALGAKYDGDPRIGYITAGLLGTWGEWHTYPREELWASTAVQTEVMEAYEESFRQTPILLRYPAGEGDDRHAANHVRPFGYHDDSFAWATLETKRREDGWFYMAVLRGAGPDALNKWQTQPIGGEIRPELWGQIFDAKPKAKEAQDFAKCVEATHVTWLMDTGLFREPPSPERKKRAIAHVQRMGYEFYVPSASITLVQDNQVEVAVNVENRGVAPFYRNWKVELAWSGGQDQPLAAIATDWSVTELLPGQPARRWVTRIPRAPSNDAVLLLRVVNPLPQGKPLRFANAEQDRHHAGWLSLHIGR